MIFVFVAVNAALKVALDLLVLVRAPLRLLDLGEELVVVEIPEGDVLVDTVLLRSAHNGERNLGRHVADTRQARVQQLVLLLVLGQRTRQADRRGRDHAVRDAVRVAEDAAKANAWEDQEIIAKMS